MNILTHFSQISLFEKRQVACLWFPKNEIFTSPVSLKLGNIVFTTGSHREFVIFSSPNFICQ